jgi:hypothetical protein
MAALVSTTLLISGCGDAGSDRKPGPQAGPSPSASTEGIPPPGVGAKAWTADLRWTDGGFSQLGLPPYPYEGVTDWQIAQAQVKYGVAAAIDDTIVVPSLPAGGGPSAQLSLRFLNSKTAAVVADRPLPGVLFQGIRARTVAGKPVVEVRYIDAIAGGEVNVLYDATGQQIWTSQGKSLSGLQSTSVGDMAAGGLFASGYRLRYTPDPATSTATWNRGGAYDVLDVADHTILTIPVNVSVDPDNPAAGIRNSVSLAGGYAVVATPDRTADAGTTVTTHITVYDLTAHGKRIAAVSEPTIKPSNGDSPARAAAAIGNKVLLTWMGPTQPPTQRVFHEGPYQDLFVTVVDTATGRSTTPVDTGVAPTGVAIPPTAFVDPSTSTVIEYGLLPNPGGTGLSPPVMFAVDLAHGTVPWKRQGSNVLSPLSTHAGILYGLQSSPTGQPRLIEVGATDGKTMADGFTVAPLAFTADGTPVFVEATVPPPSATPTRSSATSPIPTTRRPATLPDTQLIEVWVPTPG